MCVYVHSRQPDLDQETWWNLEGLARQRPTYYLGLIWETRQFYLSCVFGFMTKKFGSPSPRPHI